MKRQCACVGRGGEVETNGVDFQREGIRTIRIQCGAAYGLAENLQAGAGSKRAVARKGCKGAAFDASQYGRGWNVVAGAVGEDGGGTSEKSVKLHVARPDPQDPSRPDANNGPTTQNA